MSRWFCPIVVERLRPMGETEGGAYIVLADVPESYYPGPKKFIRLKIVGDDYQIVELIDEPTAAEKSEMRANGCVRFTEGRPGPRTTIRLRGREDDR